MKTTAPQLTASEMSDKQQLLQDYDPAREAMAVLRQHNGRLDSSFDQLWIEEREPQMLVLAPSQRPTLWASTLKVLRQEICGDEGIRSLLSDYIKEPSSAALLTSAIIYLVELTTLPINPAIATILILYLLKIGIGVFCDQTQPLDGE